MSTQGHETEQKKYPYRTTAQCRPWYLVIYPIAWLVYHIFFWLRVVGRENIPDGPAVICPRHCTAADPPIACFGLTRKQPARLMAKKELIEIPVFGKLLYLLGAFPVHRGANDMSSIKNALRCLKEGSKLIMFPEGTRVHEGEASEAKTGAIMFALRSGAPLVPVYLTRAKPFHRMTMVFGEPYHPQIAGRRATPEEYQRLADELLGKIYALESQVK